MSKPKKPAEDNSKAGAVTNSIANEVDDILGQFARFKHEIVVGVQSGSPVMTKDEAKSALLQLIANRERKATTDELKRLKLSGTPDKMYDILVEVPELTDENNIGLISIEDRIKQLQAEDKGGQEWVK